MKIKLTEGDLHQIVKESVKKILKEARKDKISYHEALETCLNGGVVCPGKEDVGLETFLRHCAKDLGYTLVSSGAFDYKSYFFEKPIRK